MASLTRISPYADGRPRFLLRAYHNGRRHQRKVPASDRQAAAQLLARFVLELDQRTSENGELVSTELSTSSIAFCDYAPRHLAAFAARARNTYSVGVRRALLRGFVRFFGDTPIDAIDGHALEQYAAHERARGLRATTTNHRIKTLRTVLRAARRDGHATADPESWKIRLAKEIRLPGRAALTELEVERLLAATCEHAPDLYPAVATMVLTGMRPGETIAMRWSWIDRAAGLIHIGREAGFVTKTGVARTIPLPSALPPYLDAWPRLSAYVNPVRRGTRRGLCYVQWPRHRFRAVVVKAGLPDVHAYSLRHTFATRFLDRSADDASLALLGEQLGHSTATMTARYLHALPSRYDRTRDVVAYDGLPSPSAVRAAVAWNGR